jgi:hypothetical protein
VEETGTRDRPLLSAALERIPPQLEASSEPRESPQAVEEVPERAEPQPDPLRVGVRIAPSFRYYGNYKHFSALGEYPQSCISIHRRYKLQRRRGRTGRLEGGLQGYRGGLFRILDMNFREFQFHALG